MMADIYLENSGRKATPEPANCRGSTSNFGFPTIQASSCKQHPSKAPKCNGTTVCVPSYHVVQIS